MFEIRRESPTLAADDAGIVSRQMVLFLKPLALSGRQFSKTGADTFQPNFVHFNRHQVRFGEVTIIRGFLFAALDDRDSSILVPAGRRLGYLAQLLAGFLKFLK